LVAIEVNERNAAFIEQVSEPAFGKHQLGVALMSRAFTHDDGSGAKPPEAFRGGSDQKGMGVDRDSRQEVHEIRLQQNCLSTDIEVEKAQAAHQVPRKLFRILVRTQNGDA
jgi:hypothetical protein